jgi:hypothetical protein
MSTYTYSTAIFCAYSLAVVVVADDKVERRNFSKKNAICSLRKNIFCEPDERCEWGLLNA